MHGHDHLDWLMLLDPMATEVLSCWEALAHRVDVPQQGRSTIATGQVMRSTGVLMQSLQRRFGALLLRVGHQRWLLFPRLQALWTLQEKQPSEPRQVITRIWLGFKLSTTQRRWLLEHGAGPRSVSR